MQSNRQKIVNILTTELSYSYCDNCKYNDYEEYEDKYCMDCHRKYQNWALSPDTAEKLADQIIEKVFKNAK